MIYFLLFWLTYSLPMMNVGESPGFFDFFRAKLTPEQAVEKASARLQALGIQKGNLLEERANGFHRSDSTLRELDLAIESAANERMKLPLTANEIAFGVSYWKIQVAKETLQLKSLKEELERQQALLDELIAKETKGLQLTPDQIKLKEKTAEKVVDLKSEIEIKPMDITIAKTYFTDFKSGHIDDLDTRQFIRSEIAHQTIRS